jgi:hypothetical protein
MTVRRRISNPEQRRQQLEICPPGHHPIALRSGEMTRTSCIFEVFYQHLNHFTIGALFNDFNGLYRAFGDHH